MHGSAELDWKRPIGIYPSKEQDESRKIILKIIFGKNIVRKEADQSDPGSYPRWSLSLAMLNFQIFFRGVSKLLLIYVFVE